MKLGLSKESIESEELSETEELHEEEPADRLEGPDESLSSEIFVGEGDKESLSSSQVLQYLEQLAQEDSNSYFIIPPGPLKKVYSQNACTLNDLGRERSAIEITNVSVYAPQYSFQLRQAVRVVRPWLPDWLVGADE